MSKLRLPTQEYYERLISDGERRFREDLTRAFVESGGQWPPPGFVERPWENFHGWYIDRADKDT